MSDQAKIKALWGVIILLLVVGLLYLRLGQPSPPSRETALPPASSPPIASPPSSSPPPSPSSPSDTDTDIDTYADTDTDISTPVYSWEEADEHYGEYVTIEGRIVDSHNSGKASFLNFHPNWRRYFTAVIFASDFPKFPANPEDYYLGKQVRVTGVVKKYQGKPEIILNSPSQIKVVE